MMETQSCTILLKQQGHFSAEVHCLAYSPAGTVIATGGGDSQVKLWKVGSGFCFVTFTGARPRAPCGHGCCDHHARRTRAPFTAGALSANGAMGALGPQRTPERDDTLPDSPVPDS